MSKLETLGNIGNLISDLRSRIAKLQEALEKVRTDIGKDIFLSKNSCENIKKAVDEITELQAKIYSESESLNLKVKGDTISAAEALVKEQYAKCEKVDYINTINDFINELHSIDEDVEILLNQYRVEIKKIVTTLNLKEQELQIQKFVVLKELYEIPQAKRLEYMATNNLFSSYPYNLLNQFIIPDGLFLGEREIITSVEPLLEAEPVAVEEPEVIPQEQEVENEDLIVASDDTKEEFVENNEEEEEQQDIKAEEKQEVNSPDDSVLYAGEIELIFDGDEPVKKTFKAKSVRGEFEGTPMPGIFKFIRKEGFFNINWVKEVADQDGSMHKFIIDKFAAKGYLKKFNIFDDEMYAVSEYGANVFTSKLLTSIWELDGLNMNEFAKFYKTITKINAWSAMQNSIIGHKIGKNIDFNSAQIYHTDNANGVLLRQEQHDEGRKVAFIGIFNNDVNDIIKLTDDLMEKGFSSVDFMFVNSPDIEHAKAVAKWIHDNYLDRNRLKGFYCFNTYDGDFYDVKADVPINFSDIKVRFDEEDCADESTEVAIQEPIPSIKEEGVEVEAEEPAEEETETEEVVEDASEIQEVSSGNVSETEPEEVMDEESVSVAEKQDCASNDKEENPVVALSSVLNNTEEADYYKKFNDMLVHNQFSAATAYVKALSNRYPQFQKLYDLMAYAVNDPMMKCNYVSDSIMSLLDVDDYIFMAAAIRCAFSDQHRYDYGLNALLDCANGLEIGKEVPGIVDLFDNIVFFKTKHAHGMDRYASYRKVKNIDVDKELNKLAIKVNDEMKLFTAPGKKNFPRYTATKNNIFGKGADMAEYLSIVSSKKKDNESLALVKEYVIENFLKDGIDVDATSYIESATLDNAKIVDFMDEAWDKAKDNFGGNINQTSKLTGGPRNSLLSQIYNAIELLIEYCNLLNDFEEDDDPAAIFYKTHENEIVEKAQNVMKQLRTLHKAGNGSSAVLLYTINEILKRMDGTYDKNTQRYFYIDLLKTKYVLLNDSYLPYLLEVDDNLPEMSPIRRIEQHVESKQQELEERLSSIIYDAEDNFGSIDLILKYLKDTQESELADNFKEEHNYDHSLENAMKAAELEAKNFVEKLELSHSYGQILEPAIKESILQNAELWFERAKEMKNLGLYKEITKAYLTNIARNALYIGQLHQATLDDYKRANVNWQDDETIARTVATIEKRIQQQNYSAAEDLLNRMLNDEVFEEETSDYVDHFQNFLRDYSYNYSEASNMRGNFTQILSKRLGHKDKKGAEQLNKSWILSTSHLREQKVKELLLALRFDVDTVVKKDVIPGNIHNYVVTLKKPENGRKKNYSHPIAAFGSKSEAEQFRVAFIFGIESERALLEKFKAIGEAMPTLLFLDSALSEAARRTIARKAKEEFGQIFAVVDRVVFSYLVNNFTETAVQQMLMAITMPYTYYQPYVFSSQNAIPPEMFIGRREELRKIIDPAGVNIVYGGRQLGKSALLKKAFADVDHNETNDRAVYVDVNRCNYEDAAKEVYKKLCAAKILAKRLEVVDWENLCDALYERMTSETKERIPYLLLLIDEADEFIASSVPVNYKPIEKLKKLQETLPGRFRFVMAGLRNVVRFNKALALGNNSVFAHLTSLTVKPFKVSEARELFEKPLFYLGFRLNRDEKTSSLLASIFSNTNYFPGLIQLYCAKLIESLKKKNYAGYAEADTPPYILSETHVQKILGENELQSEIKSKFFITLTLDNDEDNYYMLIALLVAYKYHEAKSSNIAAHEGCTAKDILNLAKDFNVMRFSNFTEENMDALMQEMKELNVFQVVGNNGYRFSRYNFLHMMGSEEEVINAIEEATL